MSKTRQKNSSELEVLRGENRKLRSENKQLRRRVREIDKKAHFYENVLDDVVEEVELKNLCPSCKKGILQEFDFTHVVVTKCGQCDFQKKRKPRGK